MNKEYKLRDSYDVIVTGAGPAGIFTVLELAEKHPEKQILLIEKGSSIENRNCPKRKTGICAGCKPCRITTGFAGAGAFSDGKLSLSPDVGGQLDEHIGLDETIRLIHKADRMYLDAGADPHIHGAVQTEEIRKIRTKAIQSNLKLIDCPVRHMGTEVGRDIYARFEERIRALPNIQMVFNTPVRDLIVENGRAGGIITDKARIRADKVVLAVGREGSEWLAELCSRHQIDTTIGKVDIGIRVETRNEIMQEINDNLYEGKFIYYTRTFDDKVRTFCQNPGGEVSVEYYENGLAVVNGHSYKAQEKKTDNTNFALLVSKGFTEPFNSPIAYGRQIAQLGNMLTGKKILVQRYGDFIRGRRTTDKRLYRNNIVPTLRDAVPGDLGLVLPYRIMVDLNEMIQAMDKIAPGIASDETLLYGVEVKFYSNKVTVDRNFETSLSGLYTLGDGAGITRGLMQASANGLAAAERMYAGKAEDGNNGSDLRKQTGNEVRHPVGGSGGETARMPAASSGDKDKKISPDQGDRS
ncbi:MAG: NAD(P)/FAD-dependent oxidoreductase [Eubacteriaceae bacterium]